jgi:pyruvate formate lyase activating enzyme
MSNLFSEDTKKHNLHLEWEDRTKEAYLYEKLADRKVKCRLCPRGCVIPDRQTGFCKVRKNLDGILYAESYGKATHVAIEKIETEAVFHYSPGAKILSLGNFGCNLDCDYCQNWMYSQFQYTAPEHIHQYTSDQIIDMALANQIEILSWTYNDPAVWYEFVLDTARKAQKRGLKNLFKSAFFLTPEAVQGLIEVIDIFAISIKAMDEAYYQRFTKGFLKPVLEAARTVFLSGRHLEVSNLVVTGLTNNLSNYDKMIDFVLTKLSADVPLHFTRFHPDYKYMDVPKTPIEDVNLARARALEKGLKYAYIGNAFQGQGMNTFCPGCGELLIERFGLCTYPQSALASTGKCHKCGFQTNITHQDHTVPRQESLPLPMTV